VKYFFNFLTPEDFDYYFSQLRKKNFIFNSKLDAELESNSNGETKNTVNIKSIKNKA